MTAGRRIGPGRGERENTQRAKIIVMPTHPASAESGRGDEGRWVPPAGVPGREEKGRGAAGNGAGGDAGRTGGGGPVPRGEPR